LLLGALVIAGLAYSAGGPNAQLASQNRVYGGGSFVGPDLPVGLQRNFAVDAHANGQAAYGDIEYGGGSHFMHEQVTCLAASGKRAAIGAIVTHADRPIGGSLVLMVLTDNGPATSKTVDSSTLQEINPPGDAGWPAGFPYVCPSPSAAVAMFGLGDFPLNGGNVVVQDATG
jgi:hypothetical protein